MMLEILITLTLGCVLHTTDRLASPQPLVDVAQRQISIPVTEMACASCARRLQKRLQAIDGVVSAVVDFAKSEARLTFNPKKVTIQKIVAVINQAFKAGPPNLDVVQ